MDQLALLRGIRSVENDHFLSEVYTRAAADGRPAAGVRLRRQPAVPAEDGCQLPPYVSLDRPATDQFEFEKPVLRRCGPSARSDHSARPSTT